MPISPKTPESQHRRTPAGEGVQSLDPRGPRAERAPAAVPTYDLSFQIFEAVPFGVLLTDARQPDFPIVYCNRAFESITGYSRREVDGRNCRFLQSGPDGARTPENHAVLVLVRRAIVQAEPCDVVLRNFRKDGTPFWNHLHLTPLRDAHGTLTHFLGMQEDITPQVETERALRDIRADLEHRVRARTAELARSNELLYDEIVEHRQTVNALREAEARFRGFFDNAVVGIYLSTPGGRYIEVNAALARLYGYDSPGQLKAAVADISKQIYVDQGTRAEFQRQIEQAGEVRGLEYQVRCRDGTTLWISEYARAVRDAGGRVTSYEGIVRDVSKRKSAEEERVKLVAQLNQAQKMEAIGTLAGGIAHDFNNILGVIIGFTELTAADLPAGSQAQNNLKEVLQASERARELVSQILAFSRRAPPERRVVHMRSLVREVAKLMRAALPSAIRVNADCKISSDRIVADPVQVHQVLMNLCTNAGHAMRHGGGTLTLALSTYVLGAGVPPPRPGMYPGPYLVLTVTDTGHGMTPAVLARIFEPFFTTKPVGEGTGLGLSVAHGIVTSHGGAIVVESRPGEGTTFRLYWPRTEAVETATEPMAGPVQTGTESVLIVDDDTGLRNVLGQQLRRLHYHVRTCGDSRKALALFRSNPRAWDLVITDQTMPHLSGASLAAAMLQLRPSLPVLLCTGNPDHVDAPAAHAAGVREILIKPLTVAVLSAAIRRALDRFATLPGP